MRWAASIGTYDAAANASGAAQRQHARRRSVSAQSKSLRRRSAFFLPSFFLVSSRRSLPALMLRRQGVQRGRGRCGARPHARASARARPALRQAARPRRARGPLRACPKLQACAPSLFLDARDCLRVCLLWRDRLHRLVNHLLQLGQGVIHVGAGRGVWARGEEEVGGGVWIVGGGGG